MSRPPRRHFALSNSPCGLTTALCGYLTPSATQDRDEVTCRLCIKALKASPIPPEVLAPEPWVPPEPKVANVGQRHLSPEAVRAIEESRSGKRNRAQYPNLDRALEEYMTVRFDGYSGGSASGSYEALARMGTMIQSESRNDNAITRMAESVAQIKIVLEHVFGAWESRYSEEHRRTRKAMSNDEAMLAWLLMRVGPPHLDKSKRTAGAREYRPKGGVRAWAPLKATALSEETGVPVKDLGGLNKWANRRVRIEMVSRGLLAERRAPREEHGMTLWIREMDAIAARRVELGVGL